MVPTYDFGTHSRTDKTTIAQSRQVIIIEGILIFTDPVLASRPLPPPVEEYSRSFI